MPDRQTLLKILDLARWAPSGDNTQPWRFEILSDDHVVVHGFDTRDWCVYDLDGRASQMAVGALLETLRLAGTRHGTRIDWRRREEDRDETHLRIDVRLTDAADIAPEHLAGAIETRCVQRRAYTTKPLSLEDRTRLENAITPDFSVRWFDSPREKRRMAWLMFENAKIRVTCPEAYAVHRSVIDWGQRYSTHRIPEFAVGVDRLTGMLMRWVMASWRRVVFFNRFLMGTLPPRIQLDLVPGLRCAAHFALVASHPVDTVDRAIAAGIAMQRFWLEATLAGLKLQPEMTPVIFSRYVRNGVRFSRSAKVMSMAAALSEKLAAYMPDIESARIIFIGRCGFGNPATSRSLRRELDELAWTGKAPDLR